jgi:hypothetical protein
VPDRFAIVIEARVFSGGPTPVQKVRIFDESGRLLTTVSNSQPRGKFLVEILQSATQATKAIALTFDIETPTSPFDVGMSSDRRKLAFGLESSTTFVNCDNHSCSPAPN